MKCVLNSTHTHSCSCLCGLCTGRQGCSDSTKGPAVWEVIAKIASWQPLHHSQNTRLLFLSLRPLKEFLSRKKKKKEKQSCICGWMCLIWILTFAAILAHPHPLVSYVLCSVSSLSSCSPWFIFHPVSLVFSPHLPCVAVILSLPPLYGDYDASS